MTAPQPSWRRVDIEGVGALDVRPLTLRDVMGADTADKAWFHVAIRHPDGRPVTRDELLDMPIEASGFLAQEVCPQHPTRPPNGGFGG